MQTNRIQVLDCTLRDGGLGLEDAYKNQLADLGFSETDFHAMTEHLNDSHIDIIELGSIEITEDDRRRFGIYQSIEAISEKIPADRNDDQLYVGLYRGPDTPVEDIPEWKPGMVDGARVIIRYSELQKSLDFCAELSRKGYKTFVQPMLTMRYTEEELDLIIREANAMHAYALYFVDSYGYMQEDDVLRLFKRFDEGLDKDIRIGFHAHNNMNLAFANVKTFLNYKTDRKVIVDSCAIGMGQGAGNLQTEIIIPYLKEMGLDHYNFEAALECCEIIEKYLKVGLWGYSVTRLLPALHKTAYKYAISLRNHYGLTFAQIDKVLSGVPEDLRHRYTPENTKKLLRLAGLQDRIRED